MKKSILTLLAVALSVTLSATTDTISSFMVCSHQLPLLLQTDTVDAMGNKIDYNTVLSTKVKTSFDELQHSIVAVDNENMLNLSTPQKGYTLHLIGTNLWSDMFTTATINLTTTQPAEIYIDNKKIKTKKTIETSKDKAGKLSVNFNFEPTRQYQIVVKLLSSSTDSCALAMLTIDKTNSKAEVHYTTDMKRRYHLTDNFMGVHVNNVAISPCGKYVLTGYTHRISTKKAKQYSILTEVKTGKQICPRFDKNVAWMPNSSKLYYTEKTSNGYNIITIDPKTMDEAVVASNIPFSDIVWSPNERQLIFSIKEHALHSKGPLKLHASVMDRVNGRDRNHIGIYDIASGSSVRLTAGNHSAQIHDISNDGTKILFATYTTDYSKRQQVYVNLYEINLTDMRTDTILSRQWNFMSALYSPNGKQLLITGGAEAFDGIGKNCGSHSISNDFDIQAFVYDLKSKDVTPISKNFAPSIKEIAWNNNGNIYLTAEERDLATAYEYVIKENKFNKLNMATEMVKRLTLSNNGTTAAYLGLGMNHSTRAYTYDLSKKQSTLVADPMADVYKNIELGDIQDFEFTYENTVIDGYICYPPHFDANQKYPMIVYYYGGTSPSQRWNEYYYGAHLFASRGYIVYVLNPSGTTGYGQEFSARHVNAWGKRTAEEIIYGTKLVCDKYPYIDSKRIGCIGASYGGFMTQYLQTLTDIFACAVSHAGISNVTSYWGEGYWGVGYNTVAAAESYPWNNPELFTKQGSLFNADKINTPILLLHGNKDTNVPIGESIQLYNALKIQNKEVEFIEVDGENHTIVGDLDKQILWHNSIMAWFARWLQDSPEWWNHLYPKVMTE